MLGDTPLIMSYHLTGNSADAAGSRITPGTMQGTAALECKGDFICDN
jgi:hypothetical protein